MPPLTFEQLLDRAASSRGIESGFWDIWGQRHTTGPEAKQAILRAMGFAADTPEELSRSLAADTRREWGRLLPPAIVTGESGAVELPLNVPSESLGERARISILREDGKAKTPRASDRRPGEAAGEIILRLEPAKTEFIAEQRSPAASWLDLKQLTEPHQK